MFRAANFSWKIAWILYLNVDEILNFFSMRVLWEAEKDQIGVSAQNVVKQLSAQNLQLVQFLLVYFLW